MGRRLFVQALATNRWVGLSASLALWAISLGCATQSPSVDALDREDLSLSFVPESREHQAARDIPSEGDLPVEEAIAIALANSPDLGQARARVARAAARVREARSAFFPVLGYSASARRYIEARDEPTWFDPYPDEGTDIYETGLELTYNLYSGGERLHDLRAAQDRELTAKHDQEQMHDEILQAVRHAYYQVLLAREAIGIASASRRFSERQRLDARARYEAGTGLLTEVLTFRTRVLEADAQIVEARNAHRISRLALQEIMATPLPNHVTLILPEPDLSKVAQMTSEEYIEIAEANRSDLASLRSLYSAALHRVRARRAEYHPVVDAEVAWEFRSPDGVDFNWDDDNLVIGAELSWELFDGGRRGARVLEAEKDAQLVAETYRQLRLAVRTAVQQALANIEESTLRHDLAVQTVRTAEENLRHLTEQYRAGVITITEVTEGELRLMDARLREIQAQIDILLSLSDLEFHTGGWQPAENSASDDPGDRQDGDL
jgi:outer membrane protein TolC